MRFLLDGKRDGDDIVLTWKGPAEYAVIAAALIDDGETPINYNRTASAGKDPLVGIEEDLVGDQVVEAATGMARENDGIAISLLASLASGRRVKVTSDQLWILAQAANGAYVRYRSSDLERAGVDMTVGVGAVTDLDSALADLLGHAEPARKDTDSDDWSAEASLCAALSHEALDILSRA